jgi:hypothetical protein
MKLFAVVIMLILIAVIVMLVIELGKKALRDRKVSHDRWHISPRTSAANERSIYLICAGEPEFKFWPTEENSEHWGWDRAMLEAEVQCQDLNRMRKELSR